MSFIPNFVPTTFVKPDLYLTDAWQSWFSQLIFQLQSSIGQYGFYPTSLTLSQINALPVANTIGAIVYCSDSKKFMGNQDGVAFKTFTLT
jgi:hypothetical protein